MAVIVKYVVVRDGDEKMTFATKKEADAHDKMLDIADNLYQFLKTENLDISPEQLDTLSLHLARNKDAVLQLLRGGKPPSSRKKGNSPKNKEGSTLKKPGKAAKKESQESDKADNTEGNTTEKDKPDEVKKKKTKTA
jgi:hypothetical protein